MAYKKYEFTGETKEVFGRTLHRIKRLSDGLVGGWIESEDNLSHEGECFVYDEAIVCDEAEVCDEAMVCDEARVNSFKIIGCVASPFIHIFQLQCRNRLLTAILKEDGQILYTIGCQLEITKKHFIERIYNDKGGLKQNPHRQEYLVAIELAERYFESMKIDENKEV